MIIIVFGLPGSGKSYFATSLAGILKADYINSDQVRRRMFAVREYSGREKLAVYNEMLVQMYEAIKHHKDVVLDATFYTNQIRKMFFEAAEDLDDVFFIEVRAEESLIIERLKKKRKDSEADLSVYRKIKTQWEPLYEDHLLLQSTDNNLKEMLDKTCKYLHLVK